MAVYHPNVVYLYCADCAWRSMVQNVIYQRGNVGDGGIFAVLYVVLGILHSCWLFTKQEIIILSSINVTGGNPPVFCAATWA